MDSAQAVAREPWGIAKGVVDRVRTAVRRDIPALLRLRSSYLFGFSSWQRVLSTLLGLVLVTIIGVGIRLVVMQRVQQRRERQNRQINERLKTLIAAYRTLGGSFTGNLAVDPSHLSDLRTRAAVVPERSPGETMGEWSGSERSRRIRDAVEAALSDVVRLGTAEQVRLAAQAATDMVAGRMVETARLVRSPRDFIREVLDLEAVPVDLEIPGQGPLRASATGGCGNAARTGGRAGGGGGQGGAGVAVGGILGLGAGRPSQDADALPGPDARQPLEVRGWPSSPPGRPAIRLIASGSGRRESARRPPAQGFLRRTRQ